ncbi:MAG: hypothetical protein KDE45_13740, partial [Caldilineaceae bacterium]|nr:hypothetical protein [Caldilineaceae bacterium]
GLTFIVYGLARTPLLAGLALFLVMLPLPLGGALFASLLQTKTPPDIQGRVFAVYTQIGTLLTPFSFLLTAFLVDNVFEPAVGTAGWGAFAPLLGDAPGAGMSLLLVIVGGVIVAATLVVIALPGIRRLEHALPDYEADPLTP